MMRFTSRAHHDRATPSHLSHSSRLHSETRWASPTTTETPLHDTEARRHSDGAANDRLASQAGTCRHALHSNAPRPHWSPK
jgi:hypothetical protein